MMMASGRAPAILLGEFEDGFDMVALGPVSTRFGSISDLDARQARSPESVVSISDRNVRQWTVVTVEGEMDIQAVGLLSELEDRIGSHMVFCLRGVTFMDAAALGALVKLRRKALSTGGCIRFVAPSGPVLRVLLLTGTGRAFATYDRLSDALLTPVSADPIGPP